jgi:hypothetical protein
VAELRLRVSELERQLNYSWVVHPNFFLRSFGVFGYWLVGYAVLAAICGLIGLIIGLVMLIVQYSQMGI